MEIRRSNASIALAACVAALAIAGPAAAAKPIRLAPSDRQAVNATLDVFVNHAVKRIDPSAAWNVVTPTMRAGMTRREWSGGSIPVYPYPAAGQHFHQWTIQYRTSDELAIELLLSPRADKKAKLGQFLFHVYLQPAHGRWLVDSFMPAATFAPAGKPARVQAAADWVSPGGATYNTKAKQEKIGPGQISSMYAIVPFAVLGLLLLGLAAWGVVAHLRYRRLAASHSSALPPLPARVLDRSRLRMQPDGARARPPNQP
ncbi:MAG: hypothetical protein ABI896_08055 [Actinomycetota bacterium]